MWRLHTHTDVTDSCLCRRKPNIVVWMLSCECRPINHQRSSQLAPPSTGIITRTCSCGSQKRERRYFARWSDDWLQAWALNAGRIVGIPTLSADINLPLLQRVYSWTWLKRRLSYDVDPSCDFREVATIGRWRSIRKATAAGTIIVSTLMPSLSIRSAYVADVTFAWRNLTKCESSDFALKSMWMNAAY